MKPKILDLFCGAGGAAMGLHRAGFEVIGVDILPQPHYPFEFHQANALEYPLEGVDAYWGSPPCQAYSRTRSLNQHLSYPDLLDDVRTRLISTEKPWVIENVVGAPFNHWIMLCGGMFGLKTYRHRRFESSFLMFQPHHPLHKEKVLNRCYDTNWNGFVCVCGGGNVPLSIAKEAMGIDWMFRRELSQAVPPVYSEYIGKQLLLRMEVNQ